MNSSKLPKDFFEHNLWNHQTSCLWPVSTFSLKRNLARNLFPQKQTAIQAQSITERVKEAVSDCPHIKNPLYLDFSILTPIEKACLFERSFLPFEHVEDKPHQGVLIDESKTFLIFINLEDHLLLHAIDCSNEWYNKWNILTQIDSYLGEALDYAFSPRFGFLTSDLNQCGTGFNVRAYLHLPATIECSTTESPFNLTPQDEVSFFPFYHSPQNLEEFEPNLMVIENKYRLGLPEESLLRQVYSTANRLIHAEKTFRLDLKAHPSDEIKDLVSRCFGILLHGYQLEEEETLNALSLLKLGIDLEWINGISDPEINNLIFHSQKTPLLIDPSSEISKEKLLHNRALFIHDRLKKASLII